MKPIYRMLVRLRGNDKLEVKVMSNSRLLMLQDPSELSRHLLQGGMVQAAG